MWRRLGWLVALVLVAQVVAVTPIRAAYAKGGLWTPPNTPLAKTKPVPGTRLTGPVGKAPGSGHGGSPYQVPTASLPGAATVDVAVDAAGLSPLSTATAINGGHRTPSLAQVGGAPVFVGPATADSPGRVRVRFADHGTALSAGVDGLLLSVARVDGATGSGRVAVEVDPTALSGLYGGDYAHRLELVELPECALSTPDLARCQARSMVPVLRDPATGRLIADVTLPAVSPTAVAADGVVALAATSVPAGSAGTYSATSVKGSDSWSAGGSTGDFSYSYPIQVPASLGGAAPGVTLAYASSAVDGQTVSSNEQASWIGEGWSYSPGFIERTYQPCSRAGIAGSGDTCWGYGGHEVSASGGGITGQVVWDDATGAWKMGGSNATVQLLSGAANGAYNGEYWVVTGADGTRYYYGSGKLPGAEGGTGSDPATNSAWTEPVYCPNSGDPCNSTASGQGSYAPNMAYRWNLDFVIDPHGNTTVYDYHTESNNYVRGSSHTLTPYVRGGYLSQISYGWRSADVVAEAANPAPAAEVAFTVAERCTVSDAICQSSNLSGSTAANWPDTPYDLNCNAGATNCLVASETYWSTKRLTQIQTLVNTGTTTASSYQPVDTYALNESFPDPGDGTSPALRLDSITRTGLDTSSGVTGGSVAMPAVSFVYAAMPNRVPGAVGWPAFNRYRITAVDTETGGVINIAYSTPACDQSATATNLPTPSNDTMLCYQQYWTPPQSTLTADWFEKYVVTQVNQTDPTGGSPDQVTRYSYPNLPAWHRNDSPFAANSSRTWDQFRGYGKVITESGVAPDPITETDTTYLRGMDGDYTTQTGGAQRSVSVTTTMGDTVTDANQYAGMTLETQTFSAAGGTPQLETESLPWSTLVATHAETGTGVPAQTAYYTGTAATNARSVLSTGGWRRTRTVNAFNAATGQVTQVDDQGDTSLVGTANSQETCTSVQYAPAPSARPTMISMPGRRTVVAVTTAGPVGSGPCPAASAANTISDATTFYDANTSPGVVTTGNVTKVQNIDHWSGGTPAYLTAQSANSYDAYGRLTSTTNALGEVTTTTRTPATGTLPTSLATTDVSMGWTTTTTVARARQLTTKVVDQNGNATSEKYDALGRLLDVWLPGRSVLQPASREYRYSVNGTASPTWVASLTLRDNNTYASDYVIYDGFTRARQDQTVSLDGSGGSLVTDTFYDSHGWPVKTSTPYYVTGLPTGNLYRAADADVPGQTVTGYDGRGRKTSSGFYSYANFQWVTTTGYPGVERTDTTPPAGGTASSSFTDALGRSVAVWNFTGSAINHNETFTPGAATPADVTQISYGRQYIAGGSRSTTTDGAGHQWTNTYDYQQHLVASTDPDTGAASATYDASGDVLTATSNNGARTIAYRYDVLGRPTEEHAGSLTGPKIATWSYDTAPGGRAQLASSTSYDSAGNGYTQTTTGYTAQGQPTGSTLTVPGGVPADEQRLAGGYPQSMSYTANAGRLATTSYGTGDTAAGGEGGLPAETVTNAYTDAGILGNVGGVGSYLTSVQVDPFGHTVRSTMGNEPTEVVATSTVDTATGRVLEQFLDKESGSTHVDDITTTWNPAGQVTSTKDVQGGGAATDLQCFGYNNLGQLTAAWTDTAGTTTAASPSVAGIGGCKTATPGAATIGGPAPSWQGYGYTATGDRASETDHDVTGNTGKDILHSYAYPGSGAPDELTSVTASSSGVPSGTDQYTYNPDGSVRTRVLAAGPNQTLAYDAAGRTQSVTDAKTANTASYVYDAAGNLLLERDTTAGSTSVTLYLAGEQLTLNTATQVETGLRYYHAGALTEIRSSAGTLTYESGNSQNTQTVTIDATTLAETRRYFTPYGAARGAAATWIDNRGFLNQPADAGIGLSLFGARLYDPGTGRFQQRDPVFEDHDSQQLGGYGYAGNNPIRYSDPSGTTKCDADPFICNKPAKPAGPPPPVTVTQSGPGSVTITATHPDHDTCPGHRCGTAHLTVTAPTFVIVNGQSCDSAACQAEADKNFQQIAAIANTCTDMACVRTVMGFAMQPEQLTIGTDEATKKYGVQPPVQKAGSGAPGGRIDYQSKGGSVCLGSFPSLCLGGTVTTTRDGSVYEAPSVGIGTSAGVDVSTKYGHVFGSPSDSEVDNFVDGPGISLGACYGQGVVTCASFVYGQPGQGGWKAFGYEGGGGWGNTGADLTASWDIKVTPHELPTPPAYASSFGGLGYVKTLAQLYINFSTPW